MAERWFRWFAGLSSEERLQIATGYLLATDRDFKLGFRLLVGIDLAAAVLGRRKPGADRFRRLDGALSLLEPELAAATRRRAERLADRWERVIASALAPENEKAPPGPGRAADSQPPDDRR